MPSSVFVSLKRRLKSVSTPVALALSPARINENREAISLQNQIAEDAQEWDEHRGDASYLYSGARLDYHAIAGHEETLKKFKAEPPEHPVIDFPFSVVLDTVILPLTFSVASYEFLFGR